MSDVVLETRDIVRDYHIGGGLFGAARTLRAVKGVSLKVEKGKTLAIVGESGCGKSTLARIITMIDPATSGDLLIEGEKVDIAQTGLSAEMRRKVQIVFQNPYGSLNPRQRIADVLAEPLIINTDMPAGERRDRAMQMLLKVGLAPEHFYDQHSPFVADAPQHLRDGTAFIGEFVVTECQQSAFLNFSRGVSILHRSI